MFLVISFLLFIFIPKNLLLIIVLYETKDMNIILNLIVESMLFFNEKTLTT